MARQLILGTAGHIDHGKTALVRALTGVDTDRLPEERARGITIDIGFAHLDLGEVRYGIVDVPGHERFIRNMLAGAAGIDVAMLVIAADDSIMPQTREHLAILELLQIPTGLIALTKCDLADADWLELVEDDVRSLVRGTFLHEAPIVRTSAHRGEGLDELRRTLLGIATAGQPTSPKPQASALFRLPVDRSFVLEGRGTIVTGTVWSGSAKVGDELDWLPVGRKVRIRGLHTHGQVAEVVQAGQRAAINLIGAHHTEIVRGHELASPNHLKSSRRITAHLRVLRESPLPLRHRDRVRVHLGTQEAIAWVRLLSESRLEPGASGMAQLISPRPIVCRGRQPLIIRAESPLVTLGGGVVLQCAGERVTRRAASVLRTIGNLLAEDELARADAVLFHLGAREVSVADLACELGVNHDAAQRLIDRLVQAGRLRSLAVSPRRSVLLHAEHVRELESRLAQAMARLHAQSPMEAAIPRPRIAQALAWADADLVQGVLALMIESGDVIASAAGVAQRDHAPRLTEAQQALLARLLARFERDAFTPPEPAELAAEHGVAEEEVRGLLALCVSRGELVHLGAALYLHASHHERLVERVAAALAGGRSLTVSEIRTLLDTSRKYAVPICEYLDRIGITVRRGDARAAGPNAPAPGTIARQPASGASV